MNRLQKRAWIGLAGVTLCCIITGAFFGRMVHTNVKGLVYIMISLVIGPPVGLIYYLYYIKVWTKFDEREKKIAQKASIVSSYAFAFFVLYAALIVFFTVGGKGSVPVYYLPALFLAGLFFAQFVQSAAILIQFALEQADEQ